MDPEQYARFREWETFYVIVGTSSAALIGLQFVVLTLMAERRRISPSIEIASFGTPTLVHFSTVLMVCATLAAPWMNLKGPGIAIAAVGGVGLFYAAAFFFRARALSYRLYVEDWIFYGSLPLLPYAALLIAGVQLRHHEEGTLFVCGGAVLLLTFLGIHNAWDLITYFVTTPLPDDGGGEDNAVP